LLGKKDRDADDLCGFKRIFMEGDETRPRGELKSSEILFGDVPIVS